MADEAKEQIFVINGFYMSMRQKYTQDGAKIQYYVVEWDAKTLSWEDFRGQVLGATDPKESAEGSLRASVLAKYKEFGLAGEPNVGDNGVHGSASPFEAMCERMNWLGAELKEDSFGSALLAAGISEETIMGWTKDPQVAYGGAQASLFDSLEDVNSDVCLARCLEIAGVEAKEDAAPLTTNSAFMFVKPHAVTDATKEYIGAELAAKGFTVKTEGELDNVTIETKKLIDNHYYAIANKASLTLPKDLHPPQKGQDAFAEKWGLTWAAALEQGLVLNAVDGCKKLNIDGNEMDTLWAKTKKAGELIKFGGGFYCGKVQ